MATSPAGPANYIGQLGSLGLSIGAAVPSGQDRMMGRIGRGGEDPALANLRRRLAMQNAQTAMQISASAPGVNPALANRNAQQGLAQSQIATNSELARAGVQSTMQARQSDPMGNARRRMMLAGGQTLGAFTQGVAAQEAGLNAAGEVSAALSAPQPAAPMAAPPPAMATTQMAPEDSSMLGAPRMAPPNGTIPNTQPRPPDQFDPGPSFNSVPVGGVGQLSAAQGPEGGSGMLGSLGSLGQPAMAQPAAAPPPVESALRSRMAPAAPQAAAPSPVQIAPEGTPLSSPPITGAPPYSMEIPGDQIVTTANTATSGIPEAVLADPRMAGLVNLLQEAEARGDARAIQALRQVLMTGFGANG